MDYQGMVIRPPSEADSILLQVTLGCSHGTCSFCGAYRGKRFSIKDEAQVFRDIEFARESFTEVRRLFLVDGDPLIIPQERLLRLLERVRERLPWVRRVGAYANAKALSRKSDDELLQLHAQGLGLVHMGVESGDNGVLSRMGKYGDAEFILEQGRRAIAAGMKLFVTVLLGLGGVSDSLDHARATGGLLSRLQPDCIGALSLMLIPGTPLHAEREAGRFRELTSSGLLWELRELLACVELEKGIFFSNHASNHLPLRVRLPKDKAAALERIDRALRGEEPLRSESARRL
ncbi:MAG: radical SAM protein [Desulfovibrionaceae bacterium]